MIYILPLTWPAVRSVLMQVLHQKRDFVLCQLPPACSQQVRSTTKIILC